MIALSREELQRRLRGTMEDYEIRLFKADGALSIIMVTSAVGEPEIVRAEIWSESVLLLRAVPISA